MEEFKHLNPTKLAHCLKGHEIKMNRIDEQVWTWFGTYGISALMNVADRCLSKHPKAKYIENPISRSIPDENVDNGESREECAVFEMNQRIKLLRASGLPESPD